MQVASRISNYCCWLLLLATGLHAFPALAQEQEEETDKSLEETVVVGSRIKGAVDTGALPVSVFPAKSWKPLVPKVSASCFATWPSLGA